MARVPIAMDHRVNRVWKSVLIVVLFLAVLWTPLLGLLLGVGNFTSSEENRTLAPPPRLGRGESWFAIGHAFTAYFHDHFGFRGTLITSQAWVKVRVLGVSSSREVVLGKDGWLFYAGDKSIDNHRGALPFTGDELARWVQLIKRRQDWLAGRGISMIVAIVPDKMDVYPEFLPPDFRGLSEQTRLDVLMETMRGLPNVPVLDLRPALLAAKRDRFLLYSRTDTHWNVRGAYAGYLPIIREIAKKYPDVHPIPLPYSSQGKFGAGDLAKMLGLGRIWREVPDDPPWPPELLVSNTADGDLLIQQAAGPDRRLMVFGDSFSYVLVPFLAQHFGQTLVSRSVFRPETIVKRRPDVVLIEMVERMLNLPAPDDRLNAMQGKDH